MQRELLPRTDVVSIGGRPTRVIGLDDLIRIKRYIGRPKRPRVTAPPRGHQAPAGAGRAAL